MNTRKKWLWRVVIGAVLIVGGLAAWQHEEILARWRGYKVVWMEEGLIPVELDGGGNEAFEG